MLADRSVNPMSLPNLESHEQDPRGLKALIGDLSVWPTISLEPLSRLLLGGQFLPWEAQWRV